MSMQWTDSVPASRKSASRFSRLMVSVLGADAIATPGESWNKVDRGESWNKVDRGESWNKVDTRGVSWNKADRGVSWNKADRGVSWNKATEMVA